MSHIKKIMVCFLCLALSLALVACGGKDEGTGDQQSAQQDPHEANSGQGLSEEAAVEEALQRAPEDYDFAIMVSINPAFILYVSGDNVIAYEALNEDARAIEGRCVLVGRRLEDGLRDIVQSAHEEGYLKDGGDVSLTIVSAFHTEAEADELLASAETSVLETASLCGISVNPVIGIESRVVFAEEPEESQGSSETESDAEQHVPGPEDELQEGDQGESQDESQQGERSGESQDESQQGERSGESQDELQAGNEPSEEEHHVEGCSVCQGSGICDRCGGSGTMICEECGGAGYETCSKCHGAGWAGYDENGQKTCDQCGGAGMLVHGNCNGTGIVACNGCLGSGLCSACGGSGLKPD